LYNYRGTIVWYYYIIFVDPSALPNHVTYVQIINAVGLTYTLL